MITHEHAEDRVRSWLQATAPDVMPEHVVATVFDRTARLPQRSRNRVRAFTGRSVELTFATGGMAILVALIAVVIGSAGTVAPPGEGTLGVGGVRFGDEATVARVWITEAESVAFTARRDPIDPSPYYWRAVAFDTVEAQGMRWGQTTTTARPANADLFEATADDVEPTGRKTATFTVTPENLHGQTVVSPATPISIDRDASLVTVGGDRYFAALEVANRGPYTVTALVLDEATLGAAALRAAGSSYPAEVLDLYTFVPSTVFGPNLSALRNEIVATATSTAPFDVASRAVEVLRSREFTYDTDVRDLACGSMSVAECFANYRRGYCEHYAVTMVAILRDRGIPARMVEGFLPGELDAGTGVETVRAATAHAWVEVYFPGQGWIPFDPTPKGVPIQVR